MAPPRRRPSSPDQPAAPLVPPVSPEPPVSPVPGWRRMLDASRVSRCGSPNEAMNNRTSPQQASSPASKNRHMARKGICEPNHTSPRRSKLTPSIRDHNCERVDDTSSCHVSVAGLHAPQPCTEACGRGGWSIRRRLAHCPNLDLSQRQPAWQGASPGLERRDSVIRLAPPPHRHRFAAAPARRRLTQTPNMPTAPTRERRMNIRPGPGKLTDLDNQELPPTQARFARAYFLPRGCLCPRPSRRPWRSQGRPRCVTSRCHHRRRRGA